MKTLRTSAWWVAPIGLLFLACAAPAPTAPNTTQKNAGSHDAEEAEHAKFSAPVRAFHDELRPLWHSEKGEARTEATCAHASSLRAKAALVDDKELVDRTDALAAECARNGRPDFESKLAAVHEQFHVVAKHPEHPEHH